MRVLSLIASSTEIIHSLGCGDKLIGRSHECDYPPSVVNLPYCTEPRFNVAGSSVEIDNRVKSILQEALSVYRIDEQKLIESSEFWTVTARSILVVVLTLPLELFISLGLALLLTEAFPGRAMVRTLIILPWMLPPIVNGFLWGWLLNGEYGALNGLLYQLGFIDEYVTWLKNPDTQVLWVTVVQTWTRFAFPTIILLAGLQSIPMDLLDAAKVDGASSWQTFRNIILPLLMPSIAVALTIEFIASLQIFDVIWTLTAGGSAGGAINPFTKTLMLYNYELVFRDLRIGLGAALSYLILFLSLGVAIVFVTRLYNQAVKT